MIPKNATPVERILASLDEESAEAENYSAPEIEVLPIAEIETRLDELGIGSSLSPSIKRVAFGYVRPSQKVIDALSEDQDGQDDEIERLPLERVTVKLNIAGLNYLAGLERVRELVEATAEYIQANLRETTTRVLASLTKEDRAKPASHDEKPPVPLAG